MDKTIIKQKIDDQILKTMSKIERYEDMSQPISPENAIGRISRMDAINNKSVVDAALRQAQRKLSQLKVALTKLHHPDFGTCEQCGQPIQPQRIIIRPESLRCVRCVR